MILFSTHSKFTRLYSATSPHHRSRLSLDVRSSAQTRLASLSVDLAKLVLGRVEPRRNQQQQKPRQKLRRRQRHVLRGRQKRRRKRKHRQNLNRLARGRPPRKMSRPTRLTRIPRWLTRVLSLVVGRARCPGHGLADGFPTPLIHTTPDSWPSNMCMIPSSATNFEHPLPMPMLSTRLAHQVSKI